jgi:hypothetical protein
MPFYQLPLMCWSGCVLVGGSVVVALVCRRWLLLWRLINPKTLPACPTRGEGVGRHHGILVSRECGAIVGELK